MSVLPQARHVVVSPTGRRRALRLAILLALMPAFPAPAAAQGDSTVKVTVIRATTPFEQQVDRLARTLVGQQQRAVSLTGAREQVHVTLRSLGLPESRRGELLSRLRVIETELSSIEVSRASLRRQLEVLCAPTLNSDGWLGVAFNGEYTMDATPGGVLMAVRRPPEIETVEPGSPAEKAGLRRGDILLSLGGQELSDAVIRLGDLLKPGARIPVRIKRGTDTRALTVTIEPRPADFRPTCGWEDDVMAAALGPSGGVLAFVTGRDGMRLRSGENPFTIESAPQGRVMVSVPRPGASGQAGFTFVGGTSARLLAGTNLVPVSEGIAAVTGVTRGVFVAEVARRSIAAQAGLVAGDVIVSADGRPLTTPVTLVQLMERSETRELRLQVVRNRKGETVVLRW